MIKIHVLKGPIADNTFQDKAMSCSELALNYYIIMLSDIYFDSKYSQDFEKNIVMKKMGNPKTAKRIIRELLHQNLISIKEA